MNFWFIRAYVSFLCYITIAVNTVSLLLLVYKLLIKHTILAIKIIVLLQFGVVNFINTNLLLCLAGKTSREKEDST